MNNYFPTGYQQNYPQNYPQFQNNAQQSNSIIWVQGLEGAKAYPVTAGSNVLLMDSEESVFYIKSIDQSGMPLPLRTFSYTEIKDSPKEEANNYITRDELESILKDYTKKKQKEVKKDGE